MQSIVGRLTSALSGTISVAVGRISLLAVARPSAIVASIAPSRGFAVHAGTFKTRSSVAKRFKITKSGAIVRKKGGKSHLNRHKSSARLNFLSKPAALEGGIRARYLRVFQASALAGK